MKHIVLLGSTGSIGASTVRVVEALPDDFRLVGLAAQRDYVSVLKQAAQFGVCDVAIADPEAAAKCRDEAPSGVRVHAGAAGVEALAALESADIVLCAVVGMAGLKPVLAAVGQGTDVALATKEVLVAAGHLVTAEAARTGSRLLPVDSEHSAIFQCLQGSRRDQVRRLYLTASGGPFFERPDLDLETISVEQALDHPRWDMGPKVTVDSATLMNKGLEIMEAAWMFDFHVDDVEVVVHPQSIVHSLVEFLDGSILAQVGPPDMRFAIQYALSYPERLDGKLPRLDVAGLGALQFGPPDEARFPCLGLARDAGRAGGTLPAVLNAANEVAVADFLAGKIPFGGIPRLVRAVMDRHDTLEAPSLESVEQADQWARRQAAELVMAGRNP